MILHFAHLVSRRPGSWVLAALFAIAPCAARAGEARRLGQQVTEYRPTFQACRRGDGTVRLAIRRMEIDGVDTLLLVDTGGLGTQLEPAKDWSCADTDEARQEDTRYMHAVRASTAPPSDGSAPPLGVIVNGGLLRGTGTGAFISGDLCPSRNNLDRAFLEKLLAVQSPLPVALAVSGTWLTHHRPDFAWLVGRQRTGALRIIWIDHSYHHPYVRGQALADNFLLSRGSNMRDEVLDTERLLIANGQTPSVFFRFPGLISNRALMQIAGDLHLVVLGAGAWLAQSPRARPGDIILIHLNGNEPAGLDIFLKMLGRGTLPLPFRGMTEMP